MRNFGLIDLKTFVGVVLLESKLTPPNDSCAQDAASIGVASVQALARFTMCPRLARAASFA